MTYCLNRIHTTPPDSGIRPHICRLTTHHHGPHQCTCNYQWTTTPQPTH